MAVIRQQNWLGQQRIDVPHLRALESGAAADFDLLAGTILAGAGPLVVQGFALVPLAVGQPATSLQINVTGGALLHPLASEHGTIFTPASDRTLETLNAANARVSGSFTADTVNYVGVDLFRSADATTADLVQFLDANTNLEKPREVPLARTLDYVFYISTQDFSTSPTVAPLCKVTTDANNNITALEDARNFLLRLGTGGTIPDPLYAYGWPGGRTEVGDNSDFSAADKAITSIKGWFDAVMTRLWELGGGEHWYSPTADRNVVMMRTGASFGGGDWFEWDGADLHWQGLVFVFDNSTGYYNEVADQTIDDPGLTDLADGECIYVDLDRTQNLSGGSALQPVKAVLTTLGTPTVPGSRVVIAWRRGTNVFTHGATFPVGNPLAVATNLVTGIVRLTYAAGNPAIPLVAPQDANGRIHNTATGGNAPGFQGTAHGTGFGISGGGTSGGGVRGEATTGAGVFGIATGNGTGGDFYAAGNGAGVRTNAQGNGGTAIYAEISHAGATGIKIVNNTDGAKPVLEVQDSDFNRRVVYDSLGYRMGRTSSWDVNWGTSGVGIDATFAGTLMPAENWTVGVIDADMSVTLVAPTSTYPATMISLNAVAATDANDYAAVATSQKFVHTGFTGLVFAAEWEMAAAQTSTSDRDNNMAAGLCDDVTGVLGGTDILTGNVQFIGFGIPDGNTENGWTCYTKTGSGAGVTSTPPSSQVGGGVSFAAGDILKFRIEIWGSATPTGATTVYFFIDSAAASTCTLRATHTTDIPAAEMYFLLVNQVITGGSTADFAVGPIRMEWGRYLTAPAR